MKTITGVDDPDYHRVVSRLRQRFGAPPPDHICRPQECFADAKSEEALIRFLGGGGGGGPISANVFLTRCHAIHLCSETACRLYTDNGTCPISGLQFGTMVSHYDKNDSRTWYARPYLEAAATATATTLVVATPSSAAETTKVVSVTKKPSVLSTEVKQTLASNVLRLLLWSTKREARNKHVREQLTAEANDACANYIKAQRLAHQLPFWTDLFRIRGFMMSKHPMLQILLYDETLHDYYVAIICQVWDRVVRFRADVAEKLTRADLESVAIGVLYGMRQNEYRCRGVIILAKDDFLTQELPPITELGPHFGLERSRVTRGQILFREAFEHAFASGVPHSEIELDAAAITRVAASTVDPEAAVVTRDSRNRQVKITNKGEVLFMPVSRKKQKK